MRLFPLAFAWLALSPLAPLQEASAQPAAPSRPGPAAEAVELIEQDILFAHHRILGTEPDFRALAELAVDSRPPPARPPRDPERERRYLITLAERKLKAEFGAFDMGRVFSLRVGTDILGHDAERGGIPLRTGALRGISMRNAADRNLGFTLRFRNGAAIGTIPTTDADAAAAMLQRARLASLGDWAGRGVLTIRFVLAASLPLLPEMGDAPVLAEIVSAEVEAESGMRLHSFASVGSRQAAAAARRVGTPALAAADLSGLRIGMPLAQAGEVALRHYPEARPTGFYADLPEAATRGAREPKCSSGLVADLRAFDLPLAPEDSYGACITFQADDPAGAMAGHVGEVQELRFLPELTPEALRRELEQRFGQPVAELPTGQLLWIGRDAEAGARSGLLELQAEFVSLAEGGPRREPGSLLTLTLRRRAVPAGEES
ncbi:hypothetical protein SAMN02745194_04560 [Roseomonas rosea]|uniref:Uncharacterized protein n=1 Tax=Muricoccus roseus TaxID=198092 RepID=A0A1M6QZY0_9PROT|nr:hypothetical protein [Roseomonas rosea]SHK25638.1 hypothetical protein SAMN02745194_04560 [Roseomonas rosea]